MAAARGRRAPRDASGTRGAIKATTYTDRFVIKTLTVAALTSMRGQGVGTELPRAAGAPIESCRAGVGSEAPANTLDLRTHRHVFKTGFWPQTQNSRRPRFWSRFGGVCGDALSPRHAMHSAP
jgi:hypothetical protein